MQSFIENASNVDCKALQRRCKDDLKQVTAIQVCYDCKILNCLDYYVFLGQVVNERKQVKLIAFRTSPEEVSVTAEKVFSLNTEWRGPFFNKTFCVVYDTTALNTGKKAA